MENHGHGNPIVRYKTQVRDLNLTSLAESSPNLQDTAVSNSESCTFRTNLSMIAAMFPIIFEAIKGQVSGEEFSVILCDVAPETLSVLSDLIHSGAAAVKDPAEAQNVRQVLTRLGLDLDSRGSRWRLEYVERKEMEGGNGIKEEVIAIKQEKADKFPNEDMSVDGNLEEAENASEDDDTSVQTKKQRHRKSLEGPKGRKHAAARPAFDPDAPLQFKLPQRLKDGQVKQFEETCAKCSLIIQSGFAAEHQHVHNLGKERYGIYACLMCNEINTMVRRVKLHRKTHDGEMWKCPGCGHEIAANRSKRVEAHKRNCKKGSNTYVCDICGYMSNTQELLASHRWKKHVDDPQVCEMCSMTCKNKYALRVHMNKTHPSTSQCPHCGKEMRTTYMRRHILANHTNELDLPYRCDVCGKGFANNLRLRDHKDIHENLRKHKCQLCRYDSNNKSNLLKHIREVHRRDEVKS